MHHAPFLFHHAPCTMAGWHETVAQALVAALRGQVETFAGQFRLPGQEVLVVVLV